jgi:SulP family sulfate permease
VLAFRVEAALLYFNIEHVREAVWEKIRSTAAPLQLVVCDLSTSPAIDLPGVRLLAKFHEELQAAGICLRLVGAHGKVRDALRVEGLEQRVGTIDRTVSVADAIEEFQGRPSTVELAGPITPA